MNGIKAESMSVTQLCCIQTKCTGYIYIEKPPFMVTFPYTLYILESILNHVPTKTACMS